MAENNHAEVKGSIAGQSFAVSTKDVVTVLILLMMGLAAWFAWQSNERRLDRFQDQHVLFGKMMLEQKEFIRQDTEHLFKALLVLNHNMGRPVDEQIPLGLDLPPLPSQKPPPP